VAEGEEGSESAIVDYEPLAIEAASSSVRGQRFSLIWPLVEAQARKSVRRLVQMCRMDVAEAVSAVSVKVMGAFLAKLDADRWVFDAADSLPRILNGCCQKAALEVQRATLTYLSRYRTSCRPGGGKAVYDPQGRLIASEEMEKITDDIRQHRSPEELGLFNLKLGGNADAQIAEALGLPVKKVYQMWYHLKLWIKERRPH